MEEKATQVYRAEFNGKYFWFASLIGEFTRAFKMQVSLISRYERQGKNLTEIQGLMAAGKVKVDQVQFVNLGADTCQMTLAQMIINDMKNFDSSQIYGQKIPLLMFYLKDYQIIDDEIKSSFDVKELLQLMNEYCQVDFGYPENEKRYQSSLGASENSEEYFKQRSLILNYWLKNDDYLRIISQTAINCCNSSVLSHQARSNYQEAYYQLKNSEVNPLWYEDINSGITGLTWYFTNIDQAVNILSDFKISSEKNENMLQNQYLTLPLRPKTPEQYQSEGILDKSTVNGNSLARIPVPVFICFSLKGVLERGGLLTNSELSKRDAAFNLQEDADYDLFSFNKHISSIYANHDSANLIQTKCIVKDYLEFNAQDIVKIYVRTEAEKLSLLTALVEYQAKQNFSKKHLRLIDPYQYAGRIQVEPDLFFGDRGKVDFVNNQIEFLGIDKINIQSHDEPFSMAKEMKTVSKVTSIGELIQRNFRLKDSHGHLKNMIICHKPNWILKVAKWVIPFTEEIRYYSDLYYHGKFLRVYRIEGEDDWFTKDRDEEQVSFTEDEQRILKRIEESFKVETVRKNRMNIN